jgi:hypothetical protein
LEQYCQLIQQLSSYVLAHVDKFPSRCIFVENHLDEAAVSSMPDYVTCKQLQHQTLLFVGDLRPSLFSWSL